MMNHTEQAATGAENIHWDLSDLYSGEDTLKRGLEESGARARKLNESFRGTITTLEATELVPVLMELEAISDEVGKAYTYAYLGWSTNTGDSAKGALLQSVREAYTRIQQDLVFFDVEWAAVPDQRAAELLKAKELRPYRHYLELQQIQKRHILTEPEEKIISEKDVTGRSAWNRYFDETLGAARFTFRGESITEQETLTKLSDPDRSVRKDAAMSLTAGLQEHKRTLTFIFNTLLAEKASSDRLRGYTSWISSRNLSNEIEDETVEALIDAVVGRYDLSKRYYHLKRRLLGLAEMMDYDRYAPLGETDTRYSWNEAEEIVRSAYTEFHPKMGDISGMFFDNHWIDAAVTPGKRGGAYSHGAVPSAHPYVFMNYTGRSRDVQTLAHELGHGVHQFLSREQGIFHADTPLTTAETASVFGEMLVFQKLMAAETDPRKKLTLLAGKIDDTMATVFRQVSMNRFEQGMHLARRTEGELDADRLSEIWVETQSGMFGDSVTLGDHYRIWWSYIPHFLHTPGYVYAYAFGELLVLALYAKYLNDPTGFPDKYIDLLSAGGSDWPDALLEPLGIDLKDAEFWGNGLKAIETWIDEAEALASSLSE